MGAPLFRYLLLSRGMKLEELRERLGYSRSHFSELINGAKTSAAFREQLAEFFKIGADELLRPREVAVYHEGARVTFRLRNAGPAP